MTGNIDLLGTRFDDSFPLGQFYIDDFGFSTRLEQHKYGSGIMLYSMIVEISL